MKISYDLTVAIIKHGDTIRIKGIQPGYHVCLRHPEKWDRITIDKVLYNGISRHQYFRRCTVPYHNVLSAGSCVSAHIHRTPCAADHHSVLACLIERVLCHRDCGELACTQIKGSHRR